MRIATAAKRTDYTLEDKDLLIGEKLDNYILRVRDLPNQQKPREKLTRQGPASLSVAELLAVVLGVGTRKEEVMEMSQRIIKEYGEKSVSTEVNPSKMAEALGIPEGKACQVIASFELGRRFYSRQAGRSVYVRNARQAFDYLRDMSHSRKEQLRGLYLNSRYKVVHDEVISVGSVTANIVHPREVFQPAIEHGAVAVIVAHNHPSGSLEPTSADIEVTGQLKAAGQLLGIELLDHLIIAADKFVKISDVLIAEDLLSMSDI